MVARGRGSSVRVWYVLVVCLSVAVFGCPSDPYDADTLDFPAQQQGC